MQRSKKFKTYLVAALTCAGAMVMVMGSAQAVQGDWLGRARIININPDASSSALNLDVNSKFAPELDFTYFATNNIALELILATRKHDVTSNGANIGTVKHLPPTLTVQYHFMPDQKFRPYVGAGLNYTRFYSVHLLNGAATLDKSSWGPALQVGADIEINKRFFLNVDVKRIWMDTDVKVGGVRVANLKIDPWIFGVGVGMKF